LSINPEEPFPDTAPPDIEGIMLLSNPPGPETDPPVNPTPPPPPPAVGINPVD
jgi:hypothetical protein